MSKRDTDPYWPALMKRATAARYCDMTAPEFEREVTAGNLPLPMTEFCSAPRWSRKAIDDALERNTEPQAADWRAGCKLYGQG